MAPLEFGLECPKCGSTNTASKFIFAKKIIKCGTCGEEINIKDSRMITKQCPNCEKPVVYDQGKRNAKCPHCGKPMAKEAATLKYDLVRVNCPACGCIGSGKNTDGL